MPVLEWIGKEKVVNHANEVPFHVLERSYSYGVKGKTTEDNGSENKIIHGDNLLALKSLLPEYEGRVKCIYIDPPYNTGNENWVYNDNVNDPRIKKWLGEVVGKEGEDLSRHDKWLCMMYPRLKLLRRLLADDGIIWISIGDDELANLMQIVSEVFGKLGAIFVWKSRTKPTNAGNAKYRPQKVSEYVLMYTKDKDKLFNIGNKDSNYSYPNEDEYGSYRTSTILTSNRGTYKRETMRFAIADYTPPPEKRWKAGEDKIRELLDNHRLLLSGDGDPMEKIYDYDEDKILTPLYTILDTSISGTAETGKTLLNKIIGAGHGFDTVKPVELLEYLIRISTQGNDIILDSFAGTSTTAHAVLNLNKADGGNRKFILVEMMDYADSITAERVKRVIDGYGEGKKKTEGTGGDFSFYEVGEPLFADGALNEDVDEEKIRAYIWYTETHTPYQKPTKGNASFLGCEDDTAYYFHYAKGETTTLDAAFLRSIKTKAERYVIYADVCVLSPEMMEKRNIEFKKIPRDIKKI